ncbi:unnamed protein product [Phytophthora lilii]|uniref:Unnamed protein product n=1 Tax=Phytophthora lilii TaxID=2077276 RepID=A0A9W6TY76_9STRA|nr:unnamed protein product [Phytophthora lilii]
MKSLIPAPPAARASRNTSSASCRCRGQGHPALCETPVHWLRWALLFNDIASLHAQQRRNAHALSVCDESKDGRLMEQVHDGITSPSSLEFMLESVRPRNQLAPVDAANTIGARRRAATKSEFTVSAELLSPATEALNFEPPSHETGAALSIPHGVALTSSACEPAVGTEVALGSRINAALPTAQCFYGSYQRQPPDDMTTEDISFFLSMVESMPRGPTKWLQIHAKYLISFPSSSRNFNALRCKLKKEKKRRSVEAEISATPPKLPNNVVHYTIAYAKLNGAASQTPNSQMKSWALLLAGPESFAKIDMESRR